ncbi:hypothetical protein J7M07_03895 [bacterium]|nr:hypothetical protein [bacterium]
MGLMRRVEYLILFLICFHVFSVSSLSGKSVGDSYKYDTLSTRSKPFIIFYPGKYHKMAEKIGVILENSSGKIAGDLGIGEFDTIRVYIAGNKKDYRILHRGMLPEWSEACSDLANLRLCINAEAVLRSQRPIHVVIRHELSHLLFTQRVRGVRCPTWFLEGLAMSQSGEWTFSDHWHFMVAVWKKDIPDLEDLRGRFPDSGREAAMAYRLSYIAVNELFAKRPEDLMTLTAFTRDLGDFKRAFLLTFGKYPLDFADEFQAILSGKYKTRFILAASAPLWTGMVILFLIAYSVKRYKARRKIKQWEEEEKDVKRRGELEIKSS